MTAAPRIINGQEDGHERHSEHLALHVSLIDLPCHGLLNVELSSSDQCSHIQVGPGLRVIIFVSYSVIRERMASFQAGERKGWGVTYNPSNRPS
jgi:hypothetical protein